MLKESYVYYSARSLRRTYHNAKQQVIICTIGLIRAIEGFQTGKESELATMAVRCIENEIVMHLRLLRNICNEITLIDKKPFCIELQPIIKVQFNRTAVF